jgi:hypothetical protein
MVPTCSLQHVQSVIKCLMYPPLATANDKRRGAVARPVGQANGRDRWFLMPAESSIPWVRVGRKALS